MRSWQYSDLDVDRANRFTITSVDSRLTGDNTVTNGALFKFIQRALNVVGAPLRIVASGNPSLATGGSGDLLAGFIGAFLAGGLDPLDAAALGAQVLGRSAELASTEKTARATRPGDVATAAVDYWKLLADLPAPEPPILAELAAPRLV